MALNNSFSLIAEVAVTSANVISNRFTGQFRGFGFVEMGSTQDAQTAIARVHGYDLQGRLDCQRSEIPGVP